jgi:hypothetical protein
VRSYVKFEASGVPSGTSVTPATLRPHSSTGDRRTTAGLGADAYRAASDGWSETSITHSNAPGKSGLCSIAGGRLRATARGGPTLLRNEIGAGEGNRTPITSLEGWSSTIELHPRGVTRVLGQPRRPKPPRSGRDRCCVQRDG